MTHSRTPLVKALQAAFRRSLARDEETADERAAAAATTTQPLDRRRFIGSALKTAAAVGAAGSLGGVRSLAQARRGAPTVAIVGAGLAGLTAAHRLLGAAGLRADLYEATPSPGGRINTARNLLGEGLTTEVGGEFIDSSHRDVLALARELRLPLFDTLARSETRLARDDFFIRGRRFSEREVVAEFRPFAPAIKRDSDSLPEDGDYAASESATALDRQSIEEYLTRLGVRGWFFDLLNHAFTSEFGLEIGEQSALNFVTMIGTDTSRNRFEAFGDSDERYKIRGGNDRLIQALARRLQSQIKTDRRLHAIREEGGRYRLDFGDRGEVRADYVLITIPFTTLRQVDIRVELPPRKRQAIERLGYGTNSKLVMGFDERIWRRQGFSGYLLSDTVQNGWDNSQMQNANRGPGGYTVFLGGAAGRDLTEEKRPQYLAALDAAYPGARDQFNDRARVFNWPSNPNTLGSYACYKVGQWTSISGAEGEPVGERLLFAGEHCSSDFQGFMNGAAETGRLAAQDLVRKIVGPRRRRRA